MVRKPSAHASEADAAGSASDAWDHGCGSLLRAR